MSGITRPRNAGGMVFHHASSRNDSINESRPFKPLGLFMKRESGTNIETCHARSLFYFDGVNFAELSEILISFSPSSRLLYSYLRQSRTCSRLRVHQNVMPFHVPFIR